MRASENFIVSIEQRFRIGMSRPETTVKSIGQAMGSQGKEKHRRGRGQDLLSRFDSGHKHSTALALMVLYKPSPPSHVTMHAGTRAPTRANGRGRFKPPISAGRGPRNLVATPRVVADAESRLLQRILQTRQANSILHGRYPSGWQTMALSSGGQTRELRRFQS